MGAKGKGQRGWRQHRPAFLLGGLIAFCSLLALAIGSLWRSSTTGIVLPEGHVVNVADSALSISLPNTTVTAAADYSQNNGDVPSFQPWPSATQISTPGISTVDVQRIAGIINPTDPRRGLCESPSLAKGSLHVVIGGWKESDAGLNISDPENYIWDIGLTNADVFVYRRINPEVPLRHMTGSCGMTMHERLLLPNHGREATAFFDHVVEFYDSPGLRAVVFTHGHAARAWHVSCQSVFSRSAYYYRDLADGPAGVPAHYQAESHQRKVRVQSHMMSLTSTSSGQSCPYTPGLWMPGCILKRNKTRQMRRPLQSRRRLRALSMNHSCKNFLVRWNETIVKKSAFTPLALLPEPTNGTAHSRNPFASCCASFIVPWDRVRRFPREFWLDFQSVTNKEREDGSFGRFCFEYIIYDLLGDERGSVTAEDIERFYGDADALFYGPRRSPSVQKDMAVIQRMEQCRKLGIPFHR